jgi:S1-C subfamily serine protease
VGSDRLTDVTVLKLAIPARQASIAAARPNPGSLLLILSLNPALNRLALWEGWEPDFAALITIDGQLAGFTKAGHFICASTYQPVVRELIDHGHVRRPFLGISIQTVMAEDPQRLADAALGNTAALRIHEVIPHSAADEAGLHAGDLILELAGQSVPDARTFAAAIANRRGLTAMVILRNSQRLTVNVNLQVQ